ncbi:M23 family metallopeptidase [Agromyces sp. SYSU T0242]|uniref:M23 family metallopeptidase n=1 Tax=Agromyces litoreus TaxID=3158561 RepID=UPI003391BC7C
MNEVPRPSRSDRGTGREADRRPSSVDRRPPQRDERAAAPSERPEARADVAPRPNDAAGDIGDLLGFGATPVGHEVREFDVAPVDGQASAGHRMPVGRRTPADRRAPQGPVTRPEAARPSAARAPRRSARRAVTTRMAGVVAMGFVALLALATSVPSLSLLTPAEVQAMALAQTTRTTVDGQRVDISGGALAGGIEREGYEAQTIEEYAQAAGIRAEATFTNNPLGTVQWPFAVGVHIGDRFGYRNCYGCSTNHHGQDFNPGLGAQIQSIADGVVSVSTDSGGSLGVVVMVDHVIDGQVITSVYAHMEYGSRRFEVGDTVEVGDVLGTTGNTGMSTGPHLHFEIRIGGVDGYWVDPLEWLWANTN